MSNRSRRKQRADLFGVILLVIAGAVITMFVFLYWRIALGRLDLDHTTLCPTDGARSVTVVLIDATDSLDVVQRADVHRRLEDIKDEIPRYGELELFTVVPAGDHLLDAKLVACNPGRRSDINPLYGNPTLVEKRWRDQFSAKTDAALMPLLASRPEDTSPILESIQQVAVEAFAGLQAEGITKHLIIVSDMLQNTAEFSQYGGIAPFDHFKRSTYYLKVRSDLSGVKVTIFLLNRSQNGLGRGAALMEFWKQYFEDAGVENLDVHRVEG